MRDLPPLNALRAFEATARHRSATKAAGELNVTVGAVSHQLRALVDFLGFDVFERGHRQLNLTEAGEQYFRSVSNAFDAIRSATNSLKLPHASRDLLQVRAYTTFALRWLIPRLSTFYADHRSVELMVSTSNAPVDFKRERLDFAIRLGNGVWPGAKAERLFPNVVAPVCSPVLLARDPALKTPADLSRHVLLQSNWPERRDDWREWLRAGGIDHMSNMSFLYFESSALCYQAAIEGQGLAMAQSALIQDDLAHGRLVFPFERQLDRGSYTYYLVYPEDCVMTAQMKSFRTWLLAQCEPTGPAKVEATTARPQDSATT